MAAGCKSFTVGQDRSEFDEDWNVLDRDAWGGMTVGKLLKHVPFMKGHFQVEWHAVLTISAGGFATGWCAIPLIHQADESSGAGWCRGTDQHWFSMG